MATETEAYRKFYEDFDLTPPEIKRFEDYLELCEVEVCSLSYRICFRKYKSFLKYLGTSLLETTGQTS